MSLFDNARSVVMNNKVVKSIKTTDGGVIYKNTTDTYLTIDVPLSLIYSDAFLITGTLTDIDSNGLNGKTVKLKVGNTVVDTGTTAKVDGVDGIVKFTQTPVHRGTHSFQLVFDGTSEYVESSSTVVTREIGKETSVLQVSSPVNDASIYVDESLGISGSLVTNDDEKISGASVVVSENGSNLLTLTTDGNGAFTGSLTGLSAGTHSLRFEFVSDQYYTGSMVTRSVIVNNHSYTISANVDRSAILLNDSVTITGVLLKDGSGYANQTVTIYDGTTSKGTCTTNSNGEYTKTVTGLAVGSHSLKAVTSNAESEMRTVNVYEDVVVATVTGNSITLGSGSNQWLLTTGDVIVDWGDGTSDTVNNPSTTLSHAYADGLNEHLIIFEGTITSLGYACFYRCYGLTSITIPDSVTSLGYVCFYGCSGLTSVTIPSSVTSLGVSCFNGCSSLTSITIPDSVTSLGDRCFSTCSGLTSITIPDSIPRLGDECFWGCSSLTSITIPDSVTSLGDRCFYGCSGLTSVTIPSSVTSLGVRCFYGCSSLIDYELYWETQPIPYDSQKMPVHTGTVFTIPYGTTSIYTDAGYPSARLVEREPTEPLDTTLSIASDKQTIYTDETIIITGTLLDENNNPVKQASVKLYDGNTLLDTLTTDNAGAYTKTITGLSSGSHSLHASFEGTSNFNASTSSNIIITVSEPTYNLVLSSDTPIIQKESTATINALLTHNGSAYSNQSLSYTVKHGSTTINTGTVTTGSDGTASISYTGSGVGDVDVIVSYGTLLQETFVIRDSSFVDIATTGQKSNYWRNNNGWSLVTDTTGTTITEITNGQELMPSTVENATYFSQRRLFDVDFCVEMDISDIENYPRFIFYVNNSNYPLTFSESGHYKFFVKSTGITYEVNGSTGTLLDGAVTTQVSMGFVDGNISSTGSLKYKNFCIYPI